MTKKREPALVIDLKPHLDAKQAEREARWIARCPSSRTLRRPTISRAGF